MKLGTVTPAAAGSNAAPAAPARSTPGAADPTFAQAPAPGQSPSSPQVSVDAAREVAARINAFMQSSSANVQFMVDGKSNDVIVRVVDTQTNQLIRQIPSEEMLAISQELDRVTGLLFEQKA
jgi:flagellar protein FlaG